MSGSEHNKSTNSKSESYFVAIFLLAVCATMARFVHEGWYLYCARLGVTLFESPVQRYAPDGYRIAIPALGRLISHVSHLSGPLVAAVMDFGFGFLALYLFYQLAVADLTATGEARLRPAVVGLFLAFLYFSVTWVVPWQRPETLPTAFYLACVLTLLLRGPQGRGLWSLVLLALTAWQGFVRSDVPFILGVSLVAISLTTASAAQFGSRRVTLLRGAAMAMVAVSIQLYLQFVRYPHLSYTPGTPVVQLRNNLTLHNLSSLALALLPVLLLIGMLAVQKMRLSGLDRLILTASALYLPLWMTVGVVAEVRIYVPFLMALCVVSARVGAALLAAERMFIPTATASENVSTR